MRAQRPAGLCAGMNHTPLALGNVWAMNYFPKLEKPFDKGPMKK